MQPQVDDQLYVMEVDEEHQSSDSDEYEDQQSGEDSDSSPAVAAPVFQSPAVYLIQPKRLPTVDATDSSGG